MWCCQCQQDVPAARGVSGPPVCPRCSQVLATSVVAHESVSSVSDCGLELDAFAQATRPVSVTLPRIAADQVAADLRRLVRMLRPVRTDNAHPTHSWLPNPARLEDAPRDVGPEFNFDLPDFRRPRREAKPAPAWGISLLLF